MSLPVHRTRVAGAGSGHEPSLNSSLRGLEGAPPFFSRPGPDPPADFSGSFDATLDPPPPDDLAFPPSPEPG